MGGEEAVLGARRLTPGARSAHLYWCRPARDRSQPHRLFHGTGVGQLLLMAAHSPVRPARVDDECKICSREAPDMNKKERKLLMVVQIARRIYNRCFIR